jgi:O-antigen ligase
MRRHFLLLLFFVLLLSEMFGWKLGMSQGFSVKNAFLYGFFLLILVERLAPGASKDPLLTKIHWPFLSLILVGCISWAFTDLRTNVQNYSSEDRLIALKSTLADFYLFFIVYYYGVRNLQDAIALAKNILVLVFASNVITVMDVYNIPDLGIIKQMEHESEANRGRLMGPIGEPNQYAAFLAFFFPSYIALAMATTRGRFDRLIYLSASVATLITLLLTGSRGGIFGFVAGAAWGYWMVRDKVRLKATIKALALALPVAGVAVALVAMKYGTLLMGRIEVTSNAGNATAASAGRTTIWQTGLNVMADHPISFVTGMGWHTFAPYVGIVPHNTYLWYFFNLGIVGIFLYLLIVHNILKLTREAVTGEATDSDMLLMGFVFGFAALLISVFFVDLFAPWYFIWAYVGVMARVAVQMKAEARQGSESEPMVEKGNIPSPSVSTHTLQSQRF